MKQLAYLFSVLFLSSTAIMASTSEELDQKPFEVNNSGYGNGNNFIFVESGIEFSLFPDGQFDFHMANYTNNVNVSVNSPNVSISFNTGYDYNGFVQYDEFGAIIQIENTPIFYDYYGRVVRVGNVSMRYNNFGYLTSVGGLYIHYNRYNQFTYCSGFINPFNRIYVYRPWHRYYRIPAFDYCVVYNRPYRQHYAPVRYRYSTPYTNNYRRQSAVASRRGNTISRRSELATRTPNRRGNSVSEQAPRGRNNDTNTTRN